MTLQCLSTYGSQSVICCTLDCDGSVDRNKRPGFFNPKPTRVAISAFDVSKCSTVGRFRRPRPLPVTAV